MNEVSYTTIKRLSIVSQRYSISEIQGTKISFAIFVDACILDTYPPMSTAVVRVNTKEAHLVIDVKIPYNVKSRQQGCIIVLASALHTAIWCD